ncbi:rhomboid family intramembrane serine protease [Kiloniella litopenaei]|uniref:rhomboid family intramembrane serine protease n=1 Tax=Kiloniella litopenaei TaxID=1549748 RepID=UPI003BAB62F9
MFFPLFDNLPRLLIDRPWVTIAAIICCCFVYLIQAISPELFMARMIYALGLIPDVLLGNAKRPPSIDWIAPIFTLVTYNFLHGGFMHLVGNMVYLWVFGDNVEDAMGHRRFFAFFICCGIIAGIGQTIITGDSQTPIVGASGAVSGILGAYLLQYPKAKVLIPIFMIPVFVRAYLLLIFWIGFQIFSALVPGQSGVAWWAHIIGFFGGMALFPFFRHKTLPLLCPDELPRGIKIRDRSRYYRR